MTATSLGLNGQPLRFLGAYIRNIATTLGLNTSPSTATITLVEDVPNGVIFTPVDPGTFLSIQVGPTWLFTGILQKYTIDVRNISGRQIQIVLSDVRDVMKNVPLLMAPGFSAIADQLSGDSHCSLMDIYGAYDDPISGINLSGWTEAGMRYDRITQAINGASIAFPNYVYNVPQQHAHGFNEEYRFTTQELDAQVDPAHLFNSNLMSLNDMVDDISRKHGLDWYITSERANDNIVDVRIKTIDRKEDNTDIDLATFLNSNDGYVISATSGLELRNDIACIVMQGARVESLTKVSILGLANEPIDLIEEGGSNAYVMTESEMRNVMAGKNSWLIWLTIDTAHGGGGGPARYGGNMGNFPFHPLIDMNRVFQLASSGVNILKHPARDFSYIASGIEVVGKVYDKLKAHADAVYGKRWVHNDILDDIIESAWTRDVVGGNQDPNEYFRQDDGRTRAYVEFSNQDAGGAFSLGLSNLTNLFGDLDVFRNVTAFGTTFNNVMAGDPLDNGTILPVELANNFTPTNVVISTERSNYIWDNPTETNPDIAKHSLFVACTVDKDGTVRIDAPVLEGTPNMAELLNMAINYAKRHRGESELTNFTEAEKVAAQQHYNQLQAQVEISLSFYNDASRHLADAISAGETNIGPLVTEKNLSHTQLQDDIRARDRYSKANRAIFAVVNTPGITSDSSEFDIIRTAFMHIVRLYGVSLFDIHSRCYQPKYAYIPTRSKTTRYGPAFPTNLNEESAGRLEIIQDDSFAPWELGSISNTQAAMQLKVDNAYSNQRFVQTANVVIEGYPELNLGDSLGFNSNINGINIAFGTDGLRTTYNLQSFTRRFGELTKDEILQAALNRNAGTLFTRQHQDQTGAIQKSIFGVNKNFGNRNSNSISPLRGGARDFG